MTVDQPRPRRGFQDLVDRARAENPEWDSLMEAARADLDAFHPPERRPQVPEEAPDE